MVSKQSKTKRFGILTSGGDCPGLNATIRGVARAAMDKYGMEVVGIRNGYRGLIENDTQLLSRDDFGGILTRGGTILGTSREKPFKDKDWLSGEKNSAPELIMRTYEKLKLDCIVVLGGNGTNTTGYFLAKEGLNVIGLPKTIDNDIVETDVTFGFHTAVGVATDAIDRLHSTAHSHNRVMIIEVMGHKAGWLGLFAGTAGGGDVILLPEIPYDINSISKHLVDRANAGKNFSIVVVAEGALSKEEAKLDKKEFKKQREKSSVSIGYRVAKEIEEATGLESRVTVLGYLQRGGIPCAYDRVLSTMFGTYAAEMLFKGEYGKMVAMRNNVVEGVPLELVAGKIKPVPLDSQLVFAARQVGTCFGD